MIYLDNAATTYPKPECVYEAINNASRNLAFNAGRGSYKEAKATFEMIDQTRNKLAALVGATGDAVSFESSATEALNLIINGLTLNKGDYVYISPFEHNAIVRPLYNLVKEKGIVVEIIPFDKNTWKPDISKLHDMFTLHKPRAVFASHISNVTGYILPYEDIFSESKSVGAVNVLDASQSYGVINPTVSNIDFVVFAGHKSLYAMFGVAGFINISNTALAIVKSGGTGSDSLNHNMPESGHGRYESGSENSIAISTLNVSLDWLNQNRVCETEKATTHLLLENLRKISKVHIFAPANTDDILGIVSIAVDGYDSNDVGAILSDEYDICVRTGYHCSPFIHDFIGSRNYNGTIRISVGEFTTHQEVVALCDALRSL